MASPLSYPLIDGYRKSFVSIEAVFSTKQTALSGAPSVGTALSLNVRGFKNITMKRKRTRGIPRGNHPNPLGKTRGSNAFECAIEMYIEEFNLLQAQLVQAALGGFYGDVFFNFSRTYTENGTDTIVDTAIGCTLDETDGDDTQSDDPTVRKIDLAPLNILFNQQPDTQPLQPVPT
jgi:hypothetical protein